MKKRIRRILQPKSQPVVVSLLIMTVVFFLAIPFLSSPVLGVSPPIVKSNVSGLQLRQAAAHIPQLSEKGIDPLEVEKLQVKVQMIYEDRVALAKLHMKISEYLSTSKNSSMVEELKRQLEESKDDILELNSLIEKYDL